MRLFLAIPLKNELKEKREKHEKRKNKQSAWLKQEKKKGNVRKENL